MKTLMKRTKSMDNGKKKMMLIPLIALAITGIILTCIYVRWDISNKEKVERQYQAALLVQSETNTPGLAGVLPLSSLKYIYAQKTISSAAKAYAEGLLKFEAENYANKGKISKTSIDLYDRAAAIDSSLTPCFNILEKDKEGVWPYSNAMQGYMEVRDFVEEKLDAYFENPPEDMDYEMKYIETYVGRINLADRKGILFLVIAGIISPICVLISAAGIICLAVSIRKGV